MKTLKINIGCGQAPIKGWQNYDNSWSIRLAKKPLVALFLMKVGMLSLPQQKFIAFAQKEDILWANAIKYLPEKTNSVDVIYSSHMIEHIEKNDLKIFFKEARRVMKIGATIRIAVPNISFHIENYLNSEDADRFIEATHLTRKRPKSIASKIKYLITGDRNHQWMYDGKSLCKLLLSAGFEEPVVMAEGHTNIVNPGALNLRERSPESVFVEAKNMDRNLL